jgi:hypothetical protein
MEPMMQSDGAALPLPVTGGPHLNALKHGLRSSAILLPGDDAAEFHALRRELFHTYQPCTIDEADCVESMAGSKWRIARCRRRQAGYEAALETVIAGSPDGHLCEPDPHRWQHRSMDCVLEEMRLHRLMTRDRATLFELQRMRRNRLIDGAITVVRSYRDFLGAEAPDEPRNPADPVVAETPATSAGRLREAPAASAGRLREAATTPSNDGQNGDFRERTLPTGLAGVLQGREVATRWPRPSAHGAAPSAQPVGGHSA